MRKEIEGFPGYIVDTEGQIWSQWNNRWGMSKEYKLLKPSKRPDGYFVINLCKDGKIFHKRVAHLILETFIGKRPQGMECCHNSGKPADDSLKNLRWDTPKNNQADKLKHNTDNCGERNGRSKLNELQVRIIKKYPEKVSKNVCDFLAGIFKVSFSTIYDIKHNRSWRHI